MRLLLISLCAIACGGAARTGGTGTIAPADAGAPLDAGAAGPDGGIPAQDAGIPAQDAGVPADDAGVPAQGAGPTLPPDAGTFDGSSLSSSCDGLVPAALPPMLTHVDAYDNQSGACGLPFANGTGLVAFGFTVIDLNGNEAWTILSPGGVTVGHTGTLGGELFPLASTFISTSSNSTAEFVHPELIVTEANGSRGRPVNLNGRQLFVSDGRSLLAAGTFTDEPSDTVQKAQLFDGEGHTIWGPLTLPGHGEVAGAGIDDSGSVLVLRQDGASVQGLWIDGGGVPEGEPFVVLVQVTTPLRFQTLRLVGGGLALAVGGKWMAAIVAGSSAPTSPPDWLASRDDFRLQTVRLPATKSGYALLPRGGKIPVCSQQVEVLAASGRSCGTVAIPVDGDACNSREVRLGLDGTLLQMLPSDRETLASPPSTDVFTCTLRWWPAALR